MHIRSLSLSLPVRLVSVLAALALGVSAAPALATPVSWAATPAFNDALSPGGDNDGHAIWLPGLGNDYIPGDLTFEEDTMAGTARLFGTVVDATQPGDSFIVDIDFTDFSLAPPPGSPSKDLLPTAYSENGGPIDTSTWHYWTDFSGTLTGTGGNAGALVDVARAGPAPQVGFGANGKNGNYGLSFWLAFTVVSHPDDGDFGLETGVGDVNVDLPEPGTALLLPLGLLGIAALRRRG